jgi:hypothetical protein
MNSENKKKILMGSILSLFVVTLFIHSKISENYEDGFEKKSNQELRDVASFETNKEFHRNVQWEHELAHELATSSKDIKTAAKATTQTLLEHLMTVSLAGEYSVRLVSGKVKSIEATGDHPIFINNYIDFINQYAKLWTVG